MESLVGYGSDSENSEIGTPNRHKQQLNQPTIPLPEMLSASNDGAAPSAAQLQAEWESFAELIGDSALQGPMPVDIMSIPLPDGMPSPPAAAPLMIPTDHPEPEQQYEAVPTEVNHSSSDESERSRTKSRSKSRSRSRSSSRSSSSSSSGSESDDSSGHAASKKTKLVEAPDCCNIIPENIPMPEAPSPSAVISPTARTRNDSVTSEKSTGSKKDYESTHENDSKMSRKDRNPSRRRRRSRSRGRRRRSRSRDRRRRRRRSRSKDRRRRRSRDRKRSRSPRRRSRDKKRRSRSRSRDRKRRRRRSKSRSRGRRSQSRSRDRRRHSREQTGVKSKEGGVMKNRNLTFKEQLKKSFIAAQREIEKTGTCSLNLGDDKTEYKHNEIPSNLPLYDNPLLAVTGGADLTKNPSSNSTPQLAFLQTMQAMHKKAQELTGVSVPKYYNPAAVNPLKYAEQVQKRKLLWSKKEVKEEAPKPASGQWQASVFSQDQDGKVSAKFRKLMGIKSEEAEATVTAPAGTVEEVKKKQQEMFQRLDQEYALARMATHTHRGIGLGFSSLGLSAVSTSTTTATTSATGAVSGTVNKS
ncbi:arginine/serine-rich coiled-coil protein 2-like [Lineus longissimus]|uniref:arginine/serine-rich coiled-coil protein 2-like n=1 Tax=Lineus longissimus TaxID=88925 RepID=UPI002B4F481E